MGGGQALVLPMRECCQSPNPVSIERMELFDTHAHFTLAEGWRESFAGMLSRAREASLVGLLAVGGTPELNDGAMSFARLVREGGDAGFDVRVALGFERDQATAFPSPDCVALALAGAFDEAGKEGPPPVAVGEIGLDYAVCELPSGAQRGLFAREVAFAAERGLPVCVHSRAADADTIDVLRSEGSGALADDGRLGVLHCFTGDEAFARAVLDLGMYVSFSGILTFRNADALRTVARFVPADRLLIETDCPYLAPVPVRGKVNEPAFVAHTAACLASQRGWTLRETAETTLANARRLFGIGEEQGGLGRGSD